MKINNIKSLGAFSSSNSGGGGGGGGTSNYNDLSNKPSINSITLSGNKTGADLGLLENKATGSNSLSILGPATPAPNAILIGKNITGNYCSYSVSIGGSSAVNNAVNCVAIGYSAQSIADGATALGKGAKANASYSIQLGEGTNSTSNTLQVWDKPLLDKTTGKIPTDRMAKVIELTTTSVELASDNIYNGAELASVTFTLPSTIPANFTAQVNFTSGATATVLTAPNTVYFEGDDCSNGTLTPVANKRYQVLIASDGVNVNGYVISR